MTQGDEGTEGNAGTPGQRQQETIAIAPGRPVGETESSHGDQRGYWSKPEHWVSLLTLIAVSIYTGITALLWCNSNEQIAISRDNEHRQLRAYLYVRRFPIAVSPTTASAIIEIDHAGATPAYNVRLDADILVDQYLVGKLRLSDVTSPNVSHVVHAQYSILYSTEHIPQTISMPSYATEAMKLALAPNSNYRFYVYGVVRYLDIFGLDKLQSERRYEFCFIYEPKMGDIGTERGCEDYNKPG